MLKTKGTSPQDHALFNLRMSSTKYQVPYKLFFVPSSSTKTNIIFIKYSKGLYHFNLVACTRDVISPLKAVAIPFDVRRPSFIVFLLLEKC